MLNALNALTRFVRPRPALAPTLAGLSEQWLAAAPVTEKWRKEARRLLSRNVLPTLGCRRVDDISSRDLCGVLEPIVAPGIANNTLSAVARLYSWGRETGRLNCQNPAQGLKKRPLAPRTRTLAAAELALVWAHSAFLGDFGRICRLILATGGRPGEMGGLVWTELDLERRQIVLPGCRTKNRRGQIIPLTPLALDQLPKPRDGYPNLFGSIQGQRFNGWSAGKRLWDARSVGIATWSPHDLRRTVATQMGELGISDEVIGRVLGHAPQGVTRRHYNHSQRLAEQRAALDRWAAELARIVGTRKITG